MATLPYVIHPGYGLTSPSGTREYIDAATLAALYGLAVDDYEVGVEYSQKEIHLNPRADGKYIDIKKELGDNVAGIKMDYPVNKRKYMNERNKERII